MTAPGFELATEWVTILPETATLAKRLREFKPPPVKVDVEIDQGQVRDEARKASRTVDSEMRRATRDRDIKVTAHVDDKEADGIGNEYASRFKRGFNKGIAASGGLLKGLSAGFGVANKSISSIVAHVGTVATVIGIAAKITRGFAGALLASATALRLVSGAGLLKLAGVLKYVAMIASRLAREIARVTAAILILGAAAKVFSFMTSAAKLMGALVLGSSALIGVGLALINVFSSWGASALSALTAIGAAAGVAAGAFVGILGPAIAVAKLAFGGLGDAAKEFNKTFKDSDELFNKNLGQKMAPLLTAFHDLKQGVTTAFAGAIEPAFTWIGGALTKLQPRMEGLATTLGNLGGEIAGTLNNKVADGTFDKMFAASDRFFQNFLGESGIAGAVGGLVDFAATAADAFSHTGQNINDLLLKFGEFLRGITADQMKSTFEKIGTAISNVWNVLKPVLTVVNALGATASSSLAPGFKAFGGAISQATPGLIQMSQILLPALSKVMENLAPAIPALVASFTPWSQVLAVIAPIVADIVAKLAPLAPLLLHAVLAVKAIGAAILITNGVMFAWSVAQGVFAAATGIGTGALAGNTIALTAYKVAAVAGTAASYALSTAIAIATSPITLIIAAVAAVGIALWAFFTKTETGRKLWEKIWPAIKNAAMVAWEAIKGAFTKAWAILQPILTRIGEIAKQAFDVLSKAIQTAWPYIEKFIGFLIELWLNVTKFNFSVIIAAFKLFGSVVATVFDALKTAVLFVWNNVLQPTFTAIAAGWKILWFAIQVAWKVGKAVFDAVKTVVMFLYDNVFKPTFDAIAAVVGVAWSVMSTIFDAIKTGIDAIGTVAMWLWHKVFEPVWEGIKAGWDVLWKYLGPIFDVFKSGIQGIGDVAKKIADGIKSAWGGLKQVFLAPLHALGSFLAGVPTKILGIEIPFVADIQGWGKSLQGLAGGGIIKGPGTGTSDSILGLDKSGVPTARVSAGEGIVPEKALSTPLGQYMFNALLGMETGGIVGQKNPDPLYDWFVARGIIGRPGPGNFNPLMKIDTSTTTISPPKFATGGQVPGGRGDGLNPGAAWLKDYIQKHYGVQEIGGRRSEDGFGEHSSGNAIDIMVGSDSALGNQIAGFLKTNKDALGLNGMIWQQRSYGYGNGWDGTMMGDRGSPTQNHMDHIHAILGSGRGAGAAAVNLPTGPIIDNVTGASTSPGSASLMSNGSADGSGTGRMVVDPKKVREAEDRVTDRTNALDVANQRLSELEAKGDKTSKSTLDAARNSRDKQQRELEQAKSDLETTKQGTFKADPKSKSSASGGSDDWSSVGGMIFSGFLESFGLDGSVFKNLFDTPNVKSGMALANFGLSLLGGGGDAAAGQGNGSNGLGILGTGDGGAGILGVGTDLLAGIGDQAGVNLAPVGTPASGTGTGPAPGPTFDLRGSQLGVSPGAFDDKMGEMTAASKRFPTLGP